MRSKDVLKEAIREFDGTVILVSHDRDFLDGLATKVYEFGGGTVKEHFGGIYDFLQKKKIDSLNELQKGIPFISFFAHGRPRGIGKCWCRTGSTLGRINSLMRQQKELIKDQETGTSALPIVKLR